MLSTAAVRCNLINGHRWTQDKHLYCCLAIYGTLDLSMIPCRRAAPPPADMATSSSSLTRILAAPSTIRIGFSVRVFDMAFQSRLHGPVVFLTIARNPEPDATTASKGERRCVSSFSHTTCSLPLIAMGPTPVLFYTMGARVFFLRRRTI